MTQTEPRNATGRSRAASYQEIIGKEAETEQVAPALLEESYHDLGSEDLSVDRYFSSEFHRLEAERLWPRVWQMVCREDELGEVGDYVVYDIVGWSFIVARTGPGRIKAFYNSCLHRGTQLCTADGRVPYFRCPYHGWSYNLDGKLRSLPGKWDFAHVDPQEFSLPEGLVDTWGGFVFLNMDVDAPPLAEYLGVLPEHFRAAGWNLERMAKVAHVAVLSRCNWKVAMDGFVESYHASATHPQLAYSVGDESHQYDFWGDNISRLIGPLGMPYASVRRQIDEEAIAASLAEFGFPELSLAPGQTAREAAAEALRRNLGAMRGTDLSRVSTAELVDAIHYSAFPNFVIYGGFAFPLAYRFRPNGDDPNTSISEFILLSPMPEGVERPAPVPIHWVDSGDLTDAPELGPLAIPFNQDLAIQAQVQRGLRSARKPGVTLANYQEIRIRHYHRTLDRYISEAPAGEVPPCL